VIPGVILAAGLSSRMGRSKALLPTSAGGPTFVRQLSRSLLEGGVADVLVVARPEDTALRAEVESLGTGVRLVFNAHADRGQLSSLIAGLNAADHPGVHGVLMTPVDMPFVKPGTVRELLTAFASRHALLLRATYRGRHGHPIIFGRGIFDEVRHADPEVGAKAVVQAYSRAHADEPIDFEVDDPGILHDIDNPDDYARVINQST
jgi:molybdenum cofactor cytidylyltransferase